MGDLGLIPGFGRFPGEGKGYPLQYSSLEISMDYSPWGHKESDKPEQLSLSLFNFNDTKDLCSKSSKMPIKEMKDDPER